MKFKWITHKSPEYPATLMLRWEVLAKPLGIPPEREVDSQEQESLHLIAIDKKKLVGCICFHPDSKTEGKIFEMAVSEEYQGQSFGRQFIHTLEKMLVQKGISSVYLFAPEETESFYSLMGYSPEEETIRQRGITQKKMKKALQEPIPK